MADVSLSVGLRHGEKLHYGRTVCIGLPFMGISAFWQLYDNIVPLILKNSFALGEVATGAIMAADNVFAVILLPLLGSWSDRVDTRIGKRTPFIIVGTLLSACLMMLIPIADITRNFILFVTGLGAVLLSMGLYRSPAVALMPDLTPPKLRTQGNAVINVMGAVGAIFSLALINVLVDDGSNPDYTLLFACVSSFMIVSLMVLLLTIREKKLAKAVVEEYPECASEGCGESCGSFSPAVRKSLAFALAALFFYYMAYNGVTTAFSRYAQEVWGLSGGDFATALMIIAFSAFASYVPLGSLAARIGRRKVIGAGFFMMTVTFAVMSSVTEYQAWVSAWFIIAGVAGSAVAVNIFPVIVDMCGNDQLGKYTGLYYAFSMSAQIITPIASGFLLEHVSYLTLFPYAAVFSLLGLLAMMCVLHGDTTSKKAE